MLRTAYNAVTLSYGYNNADLEMPPLEFDPMQARMAVEAAEVSAVRADNVSKLAINELVRSLVEAAYIVTAFLAMAYIGLWPM